MESSNEKHRLEEKKIPLLYKNDSKSVSMHMFRVTYIAIQAIKDKDNEVCLLCL
jgi:hypothetical protein